MEKDFFDVFPHLKVKKELEELLDMVFVTKVSMNPRCFLIFHMSANTDPFSLIHVILLFYSVKHQVLIVVFYIT